MSLSLIPPKEYVVMSNFLQNMYSSPFLLGYIDIMQDWELNGILIEEPSWKRLFLVEESNPPTKIIEIAPGKTLEINIYLFVDQEQQLMQVFSKHNATFAWDYIEIKGIHPDIF